MAFLEKVRDIISTPPSTEPAGGPKDPEKLLRTIESIFHIKDLDTLLETVLLEARRFANAEAGTLYLTFEGYLYFSFVQNDALFRGEEAKDKYIYSRNKLPVDKQSIAGYVAMTGESLLIDNVYDIRSDVSYSFNPSYDTKSAYKTESILVVPLTTNDGFILGVLQLINAKSRSGLVIPFSMQDRLYITQFAQYAATAIEKAKLSREMVLRMVELAELRDPYETSQHAKRVGAYSVELYEKWGRRHKIETEVVRNTREILRTAAILHDIGKVAVSDYILTKPGNLTKDEREKMRHHTIHGARLFRYVHSPWDKMAAEVALNHHERWDGKGYPGHISNIFDKEIVMQAGKEGKQIPLSARIVSLADVYDALVSKRSYKDEWDDVRAQKLISNQSGKQFDPELVELFLSMEEVVHAIRNRYTN